MPGSSPYYSLGGKTKGPMSAKKLGSKKSLTKGRGMKRSPIQRALSQGGR